MKIMVNLENTDNYQEIEINENSNIIELKQQLQYVFNIPYNKIQISLNGQIINDNVNFKDILSSMTTLIRVLTGDQWNDIMHELAINQVNCTNEEQTYEDLKLNGPNGCGTWSSYPYFIFFIRTKINFSFQFMFINIIIK